MEKPNKKQIFSLLSFVASVAIFGLALYVFITSVSARSKNGQAEIFGYSFAIVVTDSMSPEIKVGDLIIVKTCDITDIKEGDNAVFLGLTGTFKDKRVVHRVVGVYEDVNEYGAKSIYLETWGISNPAYDEDYVYASNFIGKEIFHSTLLGGIMSFLRTPTNWLYLVIIFGVIYFAVKQTKKIIKLVKAKGQEEGSEVAEEKPAEGQEEQKEKLAEEENKLLAELEKGEASTQNGWLSLEESRKELAVQTDEESNALEVEEQVTNSDESTTQEEATEGQEEIVTDNKNDITNDKDIE